MIGIEPFFLFSPIWVMASAAVTMIVLRGGVSRLFFNIVGTFQASRLIHEAESASVALQGLFVDAMGGVLEAATELNEQLVEIENTIVPLAREIELATIEFEKFFDTSVVTSFQLDEMAASVRTIGAEFGYVGDEALNAGARAAQLQALYGAGVVEPLTRGGLALGFVGDMGGTDAQQSLISLMQQNAIVTGDLTQAQYAALDAMEQREVVTASVANTLNTLNSVEDRSAARMPEIIEAMNHFGGVARIAGEDIGFMAAMTATLIERGIRAETAGTALRFTYARVGGNINGAGDALNALGVATHDATGELRPMQQILNDLSPAFNQMSDQQKQALTQTMAGNRHYARLLLLMQDLERANMLYGEAQAQTGKVMEDNGEAAGYLADLFADTAFQIEQTEARIMNLQAAIGENLLPAQLAALQAQEDMLTAIDAIISQFEGTPLGSFLDDLYEMRLIMMGIFAPFATLLINVYAFHIALGGLRMVLRAISGERIAFIRDQIASNDMILIQEKLKAARFDVSNLKAERAALLQQIQSRHATILNLQAMEKLKFMDAQTLRAKKLALFAEQEVLMGQVANGVYGAKAKLMRNKQEIKKVDLAITQVENLEHEKTALLLTQLTDLEARRLVLSDAIALSTKEINVLMADLNIKIGVLNAELTESGMLAEGLMHKLSGAQMFGMALSMTAMMLSMVFMTLGTSINAVLPKQLHFQNNTQVMIVSMGLLALSFAPVIANMLMTLWAMAAKVGFMVTVASHNAILAATNWWAAASEGGFTTAVGASITAMFGKMKAIGPLILESIALAWANIKLAAAEGVAATGAAGLAAALSAVFYVSVGLLALTGVGVIMVAVAAAAIYAAKKLGLLDGVMGHFSTNLDDWEDVELPDFQTSGIDDYTDSLSTATDAQEKFMNSREEMFFGFKAGNVQGALVKQIQQQGVETFIANTEVIQTNNFNGMTTREMANIVLDSIEREAGVRGINLSGVSV